MKKLRGRKRLRRKGTPLCLVWAGPLQRVLQAVLYKGKGYGNLGKDPEKSNRDY